MATTIFNNKYPIPEGFQDILHDFIKEVIRANPNDIYDFGIQYFSKLESGQKPNNNKRAASISYTSGETTKNNTNVNFYENNTQIHLNQFNENPIHEKISDENSPIGTSPNIEANNYRPPSRLTTMSVNSTIKNDAREFVGSVISESKIKNNNNQSEKVENNENLNENNYEEDNVNQNNNSEEIYNNEENNNVEENNNTEENNNNINESINSQNKSNTYSIDSNLKNDAKEFVGSVLSESKKSF